MADINQLCRLCLDVIVDMNFTVIEDRTKDMFDVLLLKRDIDDKTGVACANCLGKLLAAFEFKSTCLHIETAIRNYVYFQERLPVDIRDFYLKETENKQLVNMLDDQKVCRLCMGLIMGEFMSVQEIDSCIFKSYIPEINFNFTGDPVACRTCSDSLLKHFGFVEICLNAQQMLTENNDNRTGVVHIKNEDVKIEAVEDLKMEVSFKPQKNIIKSEECQNDSGFGKKKKADPKRTNGKEKTRTSNKVKMKKKKARKVRHTYTAQDLKDALYEIRENKMSVREACRTFNVPKTTLLDRISGRVPDDIRKRGPQPLLTAAGENRVKEWVIKTARCGFPLKKEMLFTVVSQIAAESGKVVLKDGLSHQTWFKNFMRRNPEIALRQAEGINKAGAVVSEEGIGKWFRELTEFLADKNLLDVLDDPTRIFNGDESVFALCPKTGKVLDPKEFNDIKEGEEKAITVFLVFNAAGKITPPLVVFPCSRPSKALVESTPDHWLIGRCDKGLMTREVFFEYFANGFGDWITTENIKRPVIMFVDGHKSHMTYPLSQWCEENGLILYALPSNTTHLPRPADFGVFKPIKTDWEETVRDWQRTTGNSKRAVTKISFCSILNGVLSETDELEVCIKNGFRKSGLYPFNPDAVGYPKCVSNTAEKVKKPSGERGRNSNEISTQRDVATTKKVLEKIRSRLELRGINVDVVLNEVTLLQEMLS